MASNPEPTGDPFTVAIAGNGPAAVSFIQQLLARNDDVQIIVIPTAAGTADGPAVCLPADPRVSAVSGTPGGAELRAAGGMRLELCGETHGDEIELDLDGLAVEVGGGDAPNWRTVLAGLGAVTSSPAATRVLGGRGSVLVDGTRFAIDLNGESSVDRLFLLPSAGTPGTGEAAPERGAAAGTRMAELLGGSVSQHFRDRIIYDLLWSVDRVRRPDPEVEDLLRRATGDFGNRGAVRLIDLGCGRGRNSLFAAGQGARVTAVDHSVRAIDELREHAATSGLPLRLHATDMVAWTRNTPERAEAVICVCAVHHASPDPAEVSVILKDMAGLLVPGGFLLVALLTDIRYGNQPAPPGRLMVTADDGEALLIESLRDLDVLDIHREHRRDDDVVHFDMERHELGVSFYEAVRVTALFRRRAS